MNVLAVRKQSRQLKFHIKYYLNRVTGVSLTGLRTTAKMNR